MGQGGHNLSKGSRRVTLVLLTVQGLFVRDPGNRLAPSGAPIRALARRGDSSQAFRVAPSSEWRTLHTDLVRGFSVAPVIADDGWRVSLWMVVPECVTLWRRRSKGITLSQGVAT